MFSKNKVFEQMKKTGFVGAGMKAGKGKGKRHRWDLSKLKPAPAADEPEVKDDPVEEEAEMPQMPHMQIHVNLPGSMMSELHKMNPKRRTK